jgi:uncharacterized membrane protein
MFFLEKILMKIRILFIVFLIASLTLPLISYRPAYGEDQIEYTIQIGGDGSATWIIRRTVGIQDSIDTLEEFQNKVEELVETAKNKTGRDMAVDIESMTFTPSEFNVTVEYKVYWRNFSKVEDKKIIISDVFQVKDIFLQLYGNGEIYITYSSQYIVETVSPSPQERNNSLQILKWSKTEDFINSSPIIILRNKSLTPGLLETLGQNAPIILGLVAIAAGSLIGFYVFNRHKKKEKETVKTPELIGVPIIESDEEKIVKMLKSSGGSLYQSAIVDQCKFSKAKTSQLLTTLERRGTVSRYKKGRDKIVILIEQDKK